MKVRYIYDQLLPSRDTDTEQVLNTVTALGRRGVDVELVIPSPEGVPPDTQAIRDYYQVKGPLTLASEPVARLGNRPLQKAIHGYRAAKRRETADLVYTRNLHAVAFGLRAGYRVAYEHFRPWADQYPPLEPVLKSLFEHANFLGAILHSSHIVPSYQRVGLVETRLLVAHNGYEPLRMEPRLERGEARRLLELEEHGPLVIYAGRINESKGLSAIFELARRLPDVRFLLVGSENPEGPIERQARAYPNVSIRPWQRFDATIRYLYAADVLIIPPSREPLERHGNTVLPMKLFSYLASGRPIFAPEAPDTADLLFHENTAVLVPPDNAEHQARELRALLEDPERSARIAEGALARARELTWDARAAKIEAFLEERLREHAGGQRSKGARFRTGPWLDKTARWIVGKAFRN